MRLPHRSAAHALRSEGVSWRRLARKASARRGRGDWSTSHRPPGDNIILLATSDYDWVAADAISGPIP